MDTSFFYKLWLIGDLAGLTDTEVKLLVWRFFNRQSYRRMAELGEIKGGRKAVERIIKRVLKNIQNNVPRDDVSVIL